MSVCAVSPSSVASDLVPQTPNSVHDAALILLGKLSVGDEGSVKVRTHSSGSYSIDVTRFNGKNGYSPGSYSEGFVQGQTRDDDPFRSPKPHQKTAQRTPTTSVKRAAMGSDNWRVSSNSGPGSSPSSSPSVLKSSRSSDKGTTSFYVQEHASEAPNDPFKGYDAIKAEDSQAIFPPSCCVFVANLLQSESEESLEVAVLKIFREYGPVYVKIRRDAKHMPFAFCQYTLPEHAEIAIKEGRGRLIRGRPCRCEKAKAHRLFFVERRYGPTATPDEVQNLLAVHGRIEFCKAASHVERTALNLNEGVIVQFEMYDDGQSAHATLRNHDVYKLQPIAGLASPARPQSFRSPPSTNENRAYLDRYEVDRRSVFVGNLPMGTTETELFHLFEHYGLIDNVLLRESVSKFEPFDKFTFAFIEFKSPLSVSKAISGKNGFSFGGKSLRVSQKDSENTKPRPSRVSSGSTASYQSPAPGRVEQQAASPFAQVSPQVYDSPYAYAYGSPYYGYGSNLVTLPYSPYSYPYYASTPAYGSGVAVSGSPPSQNAYYPGYYYPAAYYPAVNPAGSTLQPQQTTPAASSTYSPAEVNTMNTAGERVSTPTPSGNSPEGDFPMKSD